MNKKMLKLFGEAFLKTLVVILGLAIVVFAIYFMIQLFGGGKNKDRNKSTEEAAISTADLGIDGSSEDMGSTEPDTEAPTEAEPISSVGKSIEVLNSTDTAGVAKGWQSKLEGAGFTVSNIGNYETEELSTTKIIVTEDGMGKDLLQYFPNATIEVGTPGDGIDIRIIVGTDAVSAE